jgi:hypothetical protein
VTETPAADKSEIVYRVNARNEIVFVSRGWDRFAASNDGERIMSSLILQQPLFDFVADPTTRALYRRVLDLARTGRALRFELRCDSPSCRRLLAMTVTPAENGDVDFCTHVLSAQERESQALLDPDVARSDEILRDCSWCNRIEIDGKWIEVEDAIESLKLFEQSYLPAMQHGVCEPCFAKMTETLAEIA